jgi:hypothetical protein
MLRSCGCCSGMYPCIRIPMLPRSNAGIVAAPLHHPLGSARCSSSC